MLDPVLLQPDEEGFLLLGDLDLGCIGRVEGRNQVKDALIEPAIDLVAPARIRSLPAEAPRPTRMAS